MPTCHNVSNCSGNGLCIDFGACHCYKGWTGSNCTEYSCERFDYCSGKDCIYFFKWDIICFKLLLRRLLTLFKIEEHLKLKNLYGGCEGQLKASKDIKKMVHETTFVSGSQNKWASIFVSNA